MSRKQFWKAIIQKSGPLLGLGMLGLNFGVDIVLDPSFESWRFGRINFGNYAYLVGGAFIAFGCFCLFGGAVKIVEVVKGQQ